MCRRPPSLPRASPLPEPLAPPHPDHGQPAPAPAPAPRAGHPWALAGLFSSASVAFSIATPPTDGSPSWCSPWPRASDPGGRPTLSQVATSPPTPASRPTVQITNSAGGLGLGWSGLLAVQHGHL